MVVVSHRLGRKRIKKEVNKWLKLILVNKIGGYFLFQINGNESKYDGFFVFDMNKKEMHKIIESIEIKDFNVTDVNNSFYSFDIIDNNIVNNKNTDINKNNNKNKKTKNKNNKINFFTPHHYNSVIINSNNKNNFTINLDVRNITDEREWGRYYEFIEKKKNKVIIKFTKKTDKREDRTHGMKELVYFIVISTDGVIKKVDNWHKKYYEFDQKRKDSFERFVYSSVNINGKNIIISISKRKDVAINDNNYIQKNINKLKEKQKNELSKLIKIKTKIKNKNIDFAYRCAINSLNNLTLNNGIFAGLPWFYQFWTRDEAISIKALSFYDEEKAKNILIKQIEKILPDGRIPNIRFGGYAGSPTSSADGIGWCVKRLSQTRLDDVEKVFVSAKLSYSINKLLEFHTKNGFAINKPKETWMDTSPNNIDQRDGARIEMQALRLNMYKYLHKISNNKKYLELEKELRKKVRKKFWDENILFDGINDKTIRPNIFITAYVYPRLLTKKEWKKCFENSLPKLWCEWGGLTTIDKSDPRFVEHYTGRDNLSYHRGDSWFWINNLSALVMHKIDKKIFKNYINDIIKASTNEILFSGIIGSHTELSNASNLSSEASLIQAWSMAMYIELINEVFG